MHNLTNRNHFLKFFKKLLDRNKKYFYNYVKSSTNPEKLTVHRKEVRIRIKVVKQRQDY